MAVPSRHYERHSPAAGTYFVTAEVSGRRPLLQTEGSARLFIDVLYRCRADGVFRLHAFVVMPEHFHALLTPHKSVSHAMQFIKGRFARDAREQLGFRLGVWQRGFSDHQLRGSVDFQRHLEYIFDNPVKAHLCSDASEYPYSSASPAFEVDPAPPGLKPPFQYEDAVAARRKAVP